MVVVAEAMVVEDLVVVPSLCREAKASIETAVKILKGGGRAPEAGNPRGPYEVCLLRKSQGLMPTTEAAELVAMFRGQIILCC